MTSERSRVSEQEVAIARVYAEALLRLAEADGVSAAILEELETLTELLEKEPGLERYLTSLVTDADERSETLDRLFRGRMSDLLLNTLQVMDRKGRAGLIPVLSEAYLQEYEKLKGIVDVKVRSAVPLSEAQRSRLAQVVERKTGLKTRLIERVNPEILAGLVIEIGDQKIDGSALKELRSMRQKLVERASREAQSGGAGLGFEPAGS